MPGLFWRSGCSGSILAALSGVWNGPVDLGSNYAIGLLGSPIHGQA